MLLGWHSWVVVELWDGLFTFGRGQEVVFIGFIPPNTIAMTIVYVLIVFHNEHTSTALNSCSFPYHLSHTLSGRFL